MEDISAVMYALLHPNVDVEAVLVSGSGLLYSLKHNFFKKKWILIINFNKYFVILNKNNNYRGN